MATRIRLQRHGKKRHPFYHIVIADARAKRDGKFIEKIGTYNPNTNPATIDLDFERALNWLQTGAEMSDTARAILSYKGVLYKNHLVKGVAKGALTEADVDKKFNAWLEQKEGKIDTKISDLSKKSSDAKAAQLAKEQEAKEAKAEAIAAKNTPPVPEAEEAPAEETNEATAEAVAETPTTETEVKAEEAPVTEKEEVKKETPAETPAAETPAAETEAKTEEAPVAEKEEVKEEKAEKAPEKKENAAK